jgi:hypothetical protein
VIYFNKNVEFACVREKGFKADLVKHGIYTFKMSNVTSFQDKVFY